jgi:hypothetical protein
MVSNGRRPTIQAIALAVKVTPHLERRTASASEVVIFGPTVGRPRYEHLPILRSENWLVQRRA